MTTTAATARPQQTYIPQEPERWNCPFDDCPMVSHEVYPQPAPPALAAHLDTPGNPVAYCPVTKQPFQQDSYRLDRERRRQEARDAFNAVLSRQLLAELPAGAIKIQAELNLDQPELRRTMSLRWFDTADWSEHEAHWEIKAGGVAQPIPADTARTTSLCAPGHSFRRTSTDRNGRRLSPPAGYSGRSG